MNCLFLFLSFLSWSIQAEIIITFLLSFLDEGGKSQDLWLTLDGYIWTRHFWSIVWCCCSDNLMVFAHFFNSCLVNQLVRIIIRRFIKNTLRLFEWDKYKTVTINKSNIYWLALNFVTQLLWYFRRIGAVLELTSFVVLLITLKKSLTKVILIKYYSELFLMNRIFDFYWFVLVWTGLVFWVHDFITLLNETEMMF